MKLKKKILKKRKEKMNNGISPVLTVYTTSSNSEIKKNLRSEKILEWDERKIMKRKFEEERTRVQPIYNSKGKLIEYYDSGKKLDFMA
jgi:hypothetical protein